MQAVPVASEFIQQFLFIWTARSVADLPWGWQGWSTFQLHQDPVAGEWSLCTYTQRARWERKEKDAMARIYLRAAGLQAPPPTLQLWQFPIFALFSSGFRCNEEQINQHSLSTCESRQDSEKQKNVKRQNYSSVLPTRAVRMRKTGYQQTSLWKWPTTSQLVQTWKTL